MIDCLSSAHFQSNVHNWVSDCCQERGSLLIEFTVLVECVERQVLYLFLHEVFIEVFRDNLLYETVFRLGDFTLEY